MNSEFPKQVKVWCLTSMWQDKKNCAPNVNSIFACHQIDLRIAAFYRAKEQELGTLLLLGKYGLKTGIKI